MWEVRDRGLITAVLFWGGFSDNIEQRRAELSCELGRRCGRQPGPFINTQRRPRRQCLSYRMLNQGLCGSHPSLPARLAWHIHLQ